MGDWHLSGARSSFRPRDGGDHAADPARSQGPGDERDFLASVSRDIRATIRAQRSLADREHFLDEAADGVGALVLVLDAQGRVVRFNGACERLSEYRAAEVVGREIWDALQPAEIDEVREMVVNPETDSFPNAHENNWVTRSGAVRLISWENTCLTDAAGTVTHVISTGIDITDAHRGDEALHGIETVGRLLAERGPVPGALDAVLGELETRMGYRLCRGKDEAFGTARGCGGSTADS